MESLFNSFIVVALSEVGDKTQLLTLILVTRFKKPWPILAGLLIATLLNHFLAAYFGAYATTFLTPDLQRWVVATLFFIFAFWALIPDKMERPLGPSSTGAFLTTLVSFFIAEMGDKTQLATLALGAQYKDTFMVTVGTTLGMVAANMPVLWWGERVVKKIPLKFFRILSFLLFIGFGIYTLIG